MENEIVTSANEFHRFMKAREVEEVIVGVLCPSGFTYKFAKPGKFAMLFGAGQLPQFATSGAVDKWSEEGILKNVESGDPDTLKLIQTAFSVRDRLLELSRSPKIVVGPADFTKDEVSTDDVPDDDLAHMFKWIQSGGDESLVLNTFPQGSQQRSVASSNRKARRTDAKRTRGNKG